MPTERIPCRADDCANTILPATAKANDGYCMPCVQKRQHAERQEHIRQNRREVDPYAGITDVVEIIRVLHKPRPHDPLIAYHQPPQSAEELYAGLNTRQAEQLMSIAANALRAGKHDFAADIARSLATLTDYPLDAMLAAWVERNEFWPTIIFRGAGAAIRDGIIKRLNHEKANPNHALSALAWIGDAKVQGLFHQWEIDGPQWLSRLQVQPTEYSRDAGWELAESGRRDLFHHECWAIDVAPSDQPSDPALHLMNEVQATCPWCHRQLIHLVELDLTDKRYAFLGFAGNKLPILTCDACTCFAQYLYARISEDGTARLASENRRPAYLRQNKVEEDWLRSPWKGKPLRQRSRRAIHAADSYFQGSISQIGGMPTWVQDDSYPKCLDCLKTMMFIVQVDNGNFLGFEGTYYAFLCAACRVSATVYQQT